MSFAGTGVANKESQGTSSMPLSPAWAAALPCKSVLKVKAPGKSELHMFKSLKKLACYPDTLEQWCQFTEKHVAKPVLLAPSIHGEMCTQLARIVHFHHICTWGHLKKILEGTHTYEK